MELSIKYSHTSITEEVLLSANLIKGLSPPNGMTSLGKQDLRGRGGPWRRGQMGQIGQKGQTTSEYHRRPVKNVANNALL